MHPDDDEDPRGFDAIDYIFIGLGWWAVGWVVYQIAIEFY